MFGAALESDFSWELSEAPRHPWGNSLRVMGLGRVELPTSRLSGSFIRT